MSGLVSVVVPAYNAAESISTTLEAVLAQTYRDLEVIVVDDGSVDDTAEVVRQFPAVTLIQQANAGPAGARNAGAQYSNGQYIAFVDHDDIWLAEKVERQVALLEDTGAGFAICHLKYVLEIEPPAWFRGPTDGTPLPGWVPSCWLVERDTWERVGPFNADFGHGCDTDWLARARYMGIEPAVAPECLVHYRVHSGNASADTGRVVHSLATVLRAHVRRQREGGR